MVEAVKETVTGAEDVIWDLTPLYASVDDTAYTADMKKLEGMADKFAREHKGRVAELDAEEMMDAIKAMEAIYDLQGRLASYASLIYTTDAANPQYGALIQKYMEFDSQIDQKLVFFNLEWNDVDDAHAKTLLANPTIAQYRHYLESSRRYKPYQLDEAREQLLLEKDVTGRNAWTRFFTQLTSSMRYDYDGEKLTQTEVLTKLYDPDRSVREKAVEAMTAGLRERAMELTYIFNTLAADKATSDRLRAYPSWVSSRNLSNKAPDEVVEALIESVTSNYDIVHRHYTLKRKLLGLDELTDTDRYAPLPVEESDKSYTWEEAKDIVLKSFYAFSDRMGDIAKQFFDESWIHAALAPNKRGGAYANPVVPSVHPYVFMNFTGKGRDVATLAHELGHGIHMKLSGDESGLFALYTPLTTAEMASTFAEMVVFSDLMQREDDPEAKLAMLAGKIEDTFATVFRQISMNRFEHGMHTARREEGELTTERLNEIWMESQRAMFGDSVNLREQYSQWWSYVPHFLSTPGYVYAYSFGELLVLALYNIYKEQGASFVPKYVEALAAGDSDYPDQIMAKVGVDLNDPAFWNKGLDAIRDLIEQEEQLAKEVYPDKF
jgi:oligoendopeptidase F